jgi:hypothetical protein
MDNNGNVIVSGASFLAQNSRFYKITAGGSLEFSREIVGLYGQGFNSARVISSDSSGNIYIGGVVAVGSGRAFISKYNTSGVVQWQKTLHLVGSSSGESWEQVSADSSGNVYVGGPHYLPSVNKFVPLVAKYNTSGTLQWQRDFGLTNNSVPPRVRGIGSDSAGSMYFLAELYLSGDNFMNVAVKYNTSGVLQWQRQLTPVLSDLQYWFAGRTDNAGNVISAYRSSSPTEFSVVKLNSSDGTISWQRRFSGRNAVPRSVGIDSGNNVYVLLNIISPTTGYYSVSIVKYSASGVLQWVRGIRYQSLTTAHMFTQDISVSGTSMTIISSAASTNKANYDIYGNFTGYGNNIFTVRLPTDGSKTGTYTPGGGIPAIVYEAEGVTDSAGGSTSTATTFTEQAGTNQDNSASYTTNTLTTIGFNRVVA